MANLGYLALALERAMETYGEQVEQVVLGRRDGLYEESDRAPIGEPLDWLTAREWLNRSYNDSYGSTDCRPFFAYTASWVFFVHEYDGSTEVKALPRNPMRIAAEFDGLSDWEYLQATRNNGPVAK